MGAELERLWKTEDCGADRFDPGVAALVPVSFRGGGSIDGSMVLTKVRSQISERI
jgi:hypothetical protein